MLVRNFRVIAVLLALILPSAAATVVIPQATAATLIPTHLVMSISPPQVSPPDPQITVTGTLETYAVNGQSAQPVPDETVDLSLLTHGGHLSQPLGSVVTDANGQFSTTTTAEVPGGIQGHFPGDATYREGYGVVGFHAASQLPTKITAEPITPVPYGSTVNVTAQVSMQLPDGTWVPAPGSWLELGGCGTGGEFGWADDQGQLTVAVKADPQPDGPECSFYTEGDVFNSWTQSAISPQFVIPLTTFPTQVVNLGPLVTTSNNRIPAADISFFASAQWEDSAGAEQRLTGAPAQLYFEYGANGPWQLMATSVTNKYGNVTFPRVSGYLSGGKLAAGAWKVVLPAKGVYLAGTSNPYYGTLAVPVFFGGLKITGTGSSRHLIGTLRYLPKGGLLHGVRVRLLTYVNGTIRTGPTVTTNVKGAFSLRLTAPRRGQHVYYAAGFTGRLTIPGLPAIAGYAVLNPARSRWLAWP